MDGFFVLTTKGNVYPLPLLNSKLQEGEEVIVTNCDGGFLATMEIDGGRDFFWHPLEELMEGEKEYSPLKVNTIDMQLNYYKTLLHDVLQKIEFLERLSSE